MKNIVKQGWLKHTSRLSGIFSNKEGVEEKLEGVTTNQYEDRKAICHESFKRKYC